MTRKNIAIHHLLISTAVMLLLGACGQKLENLPTTAVTRPARSGEFTPLASQTGTLTPTPIDPSTPTPLPSATPTPRTHEVQKGEDMFGIALRYGVSLEALKTANPTTQPNFLSIGAVLVIPYSSTPVPGTVTETPQPGITPVPVEAGRVTCSPQQDGGIWCFQTVRNNQSNGLESIQARFRLTSAETGEERSEMAFLLLDVLPPGATLPLAAYFAPPLPAEYQVTSELLSALPNPNDGRYIPTRVQNTQVRIDTGGLSAQVSFELALEPEGSTAQRVWAVAVAYDAQGNVVGVRRWENAEPLQSGQSLPVTMNLYSAQTPIERVEVLAESRP